MSLGPCGDTLSATDLLHSVKPLRCKKRTVNDEPGERLTDSCRGCSERGAVGLPWCQRRDEGDPPMPKAEICAGDIVN